MSMYSSAPVPRRDDLSWRQSLSVSGAALTNAPWGVALLGGIVGGGADFLVNLPGFHPVTAVLVGLQVLLVIAAGGALWRKKERSRAVSWARKHPWRFATMPAVLTGVVTVPVAFVTGAGVFGSLFGGVGRGLTVFVLIGLLGLVSRARED